MSGRGRRSNDTLEGVSFAVSGIKVIYPMRTGLAATTPAACSNLASSYETDAAKAGDPGPSAVSTGGNRIYRTQDETLGLSDA